jgi:transposase
MSEIRKKYDEEFKKNAVKLSHASPKTVGQVAKDLSITENLLYAWRRKYTSDGDKTRWAVQDAETKALRLENAELKMERDMLKKATAYFANLHR